MPFNYNNIIYPEDLETPQSRAVRVGAGGRARQPRFSTEELLEAQLPQFRETRRIQRQAEIFDEERRLNERARRQAARDATIGLGLQATKIGIQLSESPTVRRLAGRVFGRGQQADIPEVQSLRIPGTGAVNKFNFGGRAETLGDFVGPPAPRGGVTRAIQPKPPFNLKLPSSTKTASPFSAFEQSRPSMTPRTAPISFSALEPGEAGANLLREGFGKSGIGLNVGGLSGGVNRIAELKNKINDPNFRFGSVDKLVDAQLELGRLVRKERRSVLDTATQVVTPQVKDVLQKQGGDKLGFLGEGILRHGPLGKKPVGMGRGEMLASRGVFGAATGVALFAGRQLGAPEALGIKEKEYDVGAAAITGFMAGGLPGAAVGAGGAFIGQNISKIGRFLEKPSFKKLFDF